MSDSPGRYLTYPDQKHRWPIFCADEYEGELAPRRREPIVHRTGATSQALENYRKSVETLEARYKIVSADAFIEVFELAEPGKDFEVYTENRLRRKK